MKKKEKNKTKKPLTLYKKSLLIYSGVILGLIIALLIYVFVALKNYEKYEVGNFIKNSISDLTYKDLVDIVDSDKLNINKYDKFTDKKAMLKAIDESLEDTKNITYELNSESKDVKKPIYDIYYKGKLILTIKLNNKGDKTRIKILNYTIWEIVDIKSHIEDGLYSVKANLPEDYKLLVNGKEVTEKTIDESSSEYLLATYAPNVKKMAKYEVSGLINKPKVEVKNANGEKVKTSKDGEVIIPENIYYKTDSNDDAQSKLVEGFDVLSFAEKYSLFLTDDLQGYYHGFNTLKQYLIEGTEMYKVAYDWSHGIDITFTSRHSLKNPTFTDEKLSNFVIYSDSAFSVNVSLKKNMVVKGEDRIMEMNDKMTFVYYNGGWKLLSMESV